MSTKMARKPGSFLSGRGVDGVGAPQRRPRRILLIDDDPVFCKLAEGAARRQGIELVSCGSVVKFARRRHVDTYDAVLLDYDLGSIRGSSVADFLDVFFKSVPVAIVSSTSEWWFASGLGQPACVKTFIHKDRPVDDIIAVARKLADLQEVETSPSPSADYETFAAAPHPPTLAGRIYRQALATVGNQLLAGMAFIAGH